jgi:hypothetical protein
MYNIFLRFRSFIKGEEGYVKMCDQKMKCEGVKCTELGWNRVR